MKRSILVVVALLSFAFDARAQDSDALFDAGGRIYQVCLACHNHYWVQVDDSDE